MKVFQTYRAARGYFALNITTGQNNKEEDSYIERTNESQVQIHWTILFGSRFPVI